MLRTSGFLDDVMFSHNGANGPESKTTHMFRPVLQVAAPEAMSLDKELDTRQKYLPP